MHKWGFFITFIFPDHLFFMAKKSKRKTHAKKSKTKPVRKKTVRTVRRKNKAKTASRNKAGKKPKKLVRKNRVVSKRVKKQPRKRTSNIKRSTTKAKSSSRNRTTKKTKVSNRRKRNKKIPKLNIHQNFAKDEQGNLTTELNSILTIEFPANTTFEQKIAAIRNHPLKEIDLMVFRYRLFPRAYMIILQTENPNDPTAEKFERANKISDPTVNPEITTIRQSILELMIAFQDNYFEYVFESENPIDSDWVYDPENITAIHIRFFYPQ